MHCDDVAAAQVDAIVQQRDMYRLLLHKADRRYADMGEALSGAAVAAAAPPSNEPSSSAAPSNEERSHADGVALESLRKDFETYRAEQRKAENVFF